MIAVTAVLVAVVATAVACVVELRRRDDVAFARANEARHETARNELADKVFALEHPIDVELNETLWPVSAGWLGTKIRRRVIVHTNDERSYDGLLELVADDGLILVGSRMLSEGGVTIAGEQFIPRSNVLFVQIPRGEE